MNRHLATAPVPPRSRQRTEPRENARAATVRVFRIVYRRFLEGRTRIGADNWRRWWRAAGLGAAVLIVMMVALVRTAQWLLARGALVREPDFLLWLSENGPFGFSTAVFFQAFGTDITLAMLIILTAGIAAWNRRPLTALSLIVGYVVLDLIVRFGWLIWARERPDVLHGGVPGPAFHAFPSGHTGKTVVIYGFLTLLWMRASRSIIERAIALVVLFFITVVVPVGRLSMGVHWPSDVAAGFLLGVVYLGVLAFALKYERADGATRAVT